MPLNICLAREIIIFLFISFLYSLLFSSTPYYLFYVLFFIPCYPSSPILSSFFLSLHEIFFDYLSLLHSYVIWPPIN